MKPFDTLALRYCDGALLLLDQRKLPFKEEWVHVTSPTQMVELIQGLAVRGAPLIGAAAAASLADFALKGASDKDIRQAAQLLKEARPTAVNLGWAIDRLLESEDFSEEANWIIEMEIEMSEQMARIGAENIFRGESILTHCNTGGLATPGIGTALGVIRKAHEQGKQIHVFVDETRPLVQGGRLTTWELKRLGVPHTLICDNMAAALMREGKIQRVLTGADRIALNGDFANKIGTYSTAVNAYYHGIPFHAVAPLSTVDPACPSGRAIPIEERGAEEVRAQWAEEGTPCFNPAFDVTPVELVSSLIFDSGEIDREKLKKGHLKSHLERSARIMQ